MSAELQVTLFDYSKLDAESRIVIQQRAGEIKVLAKRVAGDIVEIGGKLADVKDRLGGNGRFSAWLQAELGWSERTAYNFMAVHEKFGAANFAIENVAPSALYLLVAPATPEPARQAVIQMANQGEKVTHKAAKVIVEAAKEAEPKTAEMFSESDEALDSDDANRQVAAEEPPSNEADSVLTPDRVAEPEPQPKPKVKPASEAVRPVATSQTPWSSQQIVIGITLMPADSDPRGRQAIVSIRAGDGSPTIKSKRIADVPYCWPEPISEMMAVFANNLASERKPKTQPKKPARKGAKK